MAQLSRWWQGVQISIMCVAHGSPIPGYRSTVQVHVFTLLPLRGPQTRFLLRVYRYYTFSPLYYSLLYC